MKMLEDIVKEMDQKFRFDSPARKPDTMEENPLGLEDKVAHTIAKELDRHQASMFVLYHQYQKHHWLVEGPQFRDLHLYLEEAYEEIHADLDAIAERLTMLGGIPTSGPQAFLELSYIEHEPEGFYPLRSMLSHNLRAEKVLAKALRHSVEACNECSDFGTSRLLKKVLLHCEDRAHHLDHYLADDKL